MYAWGKWWRRLAVILLLTASGGFLVTWVGRSRLHPPGSEEVEVPLLVCDNPIVDVGEIPAPKAEHTYDLRNACSRKVRITKIGKSCNCLEPQFDRTVIGPGETAYVGVTVRVNPKNPALITHFRERLSIHCNDQDTRLELELAGTYVPSLYYESLQVNLLAPEKHGDPFEGKYEVFLRRDKDVKIRQLQVRNIVCDAIVRSRTPVGPGDYDKVEIGIKGKLSTESLPQTGVLVIQTSSADIPVLQVPVVLFNPRTDEIKIEPPRLAIGIVAPGSQIRREVAIHLPADAAYEVEEMKCSSPSIVDTRKEASDDEERREHTLGFRCRIDCKGKTGKIEEQIVFRLKNGARRQIYTVPVSGFIKPVVPAN